MHDIFQPMKTLNTSPYPIWPAKHSCGTKFGKLTVVGKKSAYITPLLAI